MSERMTADRWRQVGDLFDRLVTLPRPERADLLSREAAADPALKAEVEGLLREADAGAGLLDAPAAAMLDRPEGGGRPSLAYGQLIGAYRALELVGRGGMGEVYRAERADGQFEQEVALKLIRTDAIEAVDRFQAERRILAHLEHPGIARLYDGGVHSDGRPWMVMEWVEGLPITDWCREHGADLARRLALFHQVCEAVACAHRNLLVHRDLKPSNILVTGDGRVKLLDFGIAKRLADDQELTQHLSPMTPAYAAPEQLEQKPVTTATDIYTLGLVLFELLVGERPFQTEKLTVYAAMGMVLRDPPPPPSVQAQRHAATAAVPAATLQGDLDAIVGKALRKEPERRYPTVAEMQADLERHLTGAPVLAREGARLYVASRLLRRYRWAVAAVSALIVTLVAGLAGVAWQARVAQRHAEEARVQAETAEAVQKFLEGLFLSNSTNQADPEKARQRTARELLDIGASRIDTSLDDAPQAKLRVLKTLVVMYREMDLMDRELEIGRKRVALARKVDGPDDPELASALLDLGDAMLQSATGEETKAVYDEVGAILDRIGDHASPLRASYEGSLAEFNFEHGFAGALPHVREAARLFRALPPSRESFVTLYLQAIILMDGADYAAARVSLEECLAVAKALGKDAVNDHLPYLYAELGFAELILGDFATGEAHLRQSVDLAVTFNGENAADTLFALRNLGGSLGRAGHLQESLAVLTRAKAIALGLVATGNATMEGVAALERLAESQVAYGRIQEGAVTLREAEGIRGKLDVSLDTVDANLHERHAAIDLETGDYAGAAAELDRSAELFRSLGMEHRPAERDTIVLRTRLLRLTGHVGEAVKAFQEFDLTALPPAVALREAEGAATAAELSLAGGQPAAALRGASAPLARIQSSPSREYLRLYEMRLLVVSGLALVQAGKAPDAVAPLHQAVEIGKQALDPARSPVLAQAQVALGTALQASGNREEARAQAVQAAAILATQPALGEQYRAPLRVLQEQLRAAHGVGSRAPN